MIQKLEIAGVHLTLSEDVKKHVNKKIGRLDRYLPRHARTSAHAEVKLKEGKAKLKDKLVCEVILRLPDEVITISEAGDNIFSAINTTEDKLKLKLHKYKELYGGTRFHQRILTRIKSRPVDI